MSANKVLLRFWGRNNPMDMLQWRLYPQKTFCISSQRRLFCTSEFRQKAEVTMAKQQTEWNRALSEAEKIVGYPVSFLNLRWMLSDEIVNLGQHLWKLVGINHPLLNNAKNILFHGPNMQAFGLIVLLISKAAGYLAFNHIEEDKSAGVLHSQRTLAEVIEMIRSSSLLLKGVINIAKDESIEDLEKENMTLGNKIALLSGDYLLARSAVDLAEFRNQDVIWMISNGIKDMCEATFLMRRDEQNNPVPLIPPEDRTGYALKEWTTLTTLSSASLLGNCCQSALNLARHTTIKQQEAYKFGIHLTLAWQACLDLSLCANKDSAILHNLCAAPILFHIEHDPTILNVLDEGLKSVENIDYLKVHEIVQSGPGFELTKELVREHSKKAADTLYMFEDNDARMALFKIIATLNDF